MTVDGFKNIDFAKVQLLLFLKEAHEKNSFESNAERKTLPDGQIQIGPFSVPPNPLGYLDRWKSEKEGFSGMEEIRCNGQTIWLRKYDGKILDKQHQVGGELHSALSDVLRAAQKESPEPYKRGPEHKRIGDYDYVSTCAGNMQCFAGMETIIHEGKLIFYLLYEGAIQSNITQNLKTLNQPLVNCPDS